jgi:hypothetical protein
MATQQLSPWYPHPEKECLLSPGTVDLVATLWKINQREGTRSDYSKVVRQYLYEMLNWE